MMMMLTKMMMLVVVYSLTSTIEVSSDPRTLLSFVCDFLTRKITEAISKVVKITECETLNCLSFPTFRLKNLHYVEAFGNPQHNGENYSRHGDCFPRVRSKAAIPYWEAQASQHSSRKSFNK